MVPIVLFSVLIGLVFPRLGIATYGGGIAGAIAIGVGITVLGMVITRIVGPRVVTPERMLGVALGGASELRDVRLRFAALFAVSMTAAFVLIAFLVPGAIVSASLLGVPASMAVAAFATSWLAIRPLMRFK